MGFNPYKKAFQNLPAKQKYFLAIIPPEPVFSEAEALKKEVSLKYNNKSALRSPAHITLHMPFEWEEKKEPALIDTLSNYKFNQDINIRLKNFGFFEPKVVFIDVEKNETLSALQKEMVNHVKQHLSIFNEADNLRAYHPHITIAFRDLKKSDFYKMKEEFGVRTFEGEFISKEFCLLKHNGKTWDVMEKFLLA